MGGFSPHHIAVYSGRDNRVPAEQCEKELIETEPLLERYRISSGEFRTSCHVL